MLFFTTVEDLAPKANVKRDWDDAFHSMHHILSEEDAGDMFQHAPQVPWFFTGVTAPFVRQSISPPSSRGSSNTFRSFSGFTGIGTGLSA